MESLTTSNQEKKQKFLMELGVSEIGLLLGLGLRLEMTDGKQSKTAKAFEDFLKKIKPLKNDVEVISMSSISDILHELFNQETAPPEIADGPLDDFPSIIMERLRQKLVESMPVEKTL